MSGEPIKCQCGRDPILCNEVDGFWYVLCEDVKCDRFTQWSTDKAKAIAKWNTAQEESREAVG